MEMNKSILKGMIRALPHNVRGTPIPRNKMPQLKVPDLNKYNVERNTQFPVSNLIPVQKDNVNTFKYKVYIHGDINEFLEQQNRCIITEIKLIHEVKRILSK